MRTTKVITIANNKGGVGKTTTTINLSAGLRDKGYKVLVIDLDGQGNLTIALTGERGIKPTIYEAIVNPNEIANLRPREIPSKMGKGELHLISSSRDLFAGSMELAEAEGRLDRLAKVLERFNGQYDFILIDTTPVIDLITINALRVADLVIIPTLPHYLSVVGSIEILTNMVEISPKKRIAMYLLFTQWNSRSTSHKFAEETIGHWKIKSFTTKIRTNISLAEAPAIREDIFQYAPRSNGAKDYKALTEEVIEWYKQVR